MKPLLGSRVLRVFGALTLVASTVTFLFRDWELVEHIPMYLQLLAVTVAMAAGGILCQITLRESKGARTFLGLALAMVPINAAALGGLLYTSVSQQLPSRTETMGWSELGLGWTTLTVIGSCILLAGVTYLGHLAHARRHARPLSLMLGATSLTLLVPFREVTTVMVMGTVGLLATLWFDRRRFFPMPELRTWGGAGTRAIIFAPFIILFGRTLFYYPVQEAHIAGLLFLLPLLSWVASSHTRDTEWTVGLQLASVLPAIVACYYLVHTMGPIGSIGLFGDSLGVRMIVTFALASAAMLTLMGAFAAKYDRLYRGAATWLTLLFVATPLLAESQGVGSGALMSIGIGVSVGTYAYSSRQGVAFVGSGVVVVAGLFAVVLSALSLAFFTHWASLASMGVVAIVSASIYDRYRFRIHAALGRLRARFAPMGQPLEAP